MAFLNLINQLFRGIGSVDLLLRLIGSEVYWTEPTIGLTDVG